MTFWSPSGSVVLEPQICHTRPSCGLLAQADPYSLSMINPEDIRSSSSPHHTHPNVAKTQGGEVSKPCVLGQDWNRD